eukprot:scaffold2761_cov391-Prasinococcus_capsulatus_cf.AAC.4
MRVYGAAILLTLAQLFSDLTTSSSARFIDKPEPTPGANFHTVEELDQHDREFFRALTLRHDSEQRFVSRKVRYAPNRLAARMPSAYYATGGILYFDFDPVFVVERKVAEQEEAKDPYAETIEDWMLQDVRADEADKAVPRKDTGTVSVRIPATQAEKVLTGLETWEVPATHCQRVLPAETKLLRRSRRGHDDTHGEKELEHTLGELSYSIHTEEIVLSREATQDREFL